MKKYTWSTTYNAILAGWLPWLSPLSFPITTVLNALFGHLYPDIMFTFNDKDTKKVDQLVFHESGHFSHAIKAGSSYWGIVVNREFDNILSCGGDPYCDGNDPSAWSGKLIALVEGWATFTEYAVMRGYYSTAYNGLSITPFMEDFNMRTIPSTVNTTNDSWFLTGLIWDILDNHSYEPNSELLDGQTGNSINYITDNLNLGNINSNFSPVYNRLTGTKFTGGDLKSALNSVYPNKSTQINQLFESYGY